MRTYGYILVMALTTYLIRVVPFTILRREIRNRTFRSFLTYVPYVTLSVMTFPAILETTEETWISAVGFLTVWCWRTTGSVCFWCPWDAVCWCLFCSICRDVRLNME